jgi:hypothetical protein
VVVDDEHAFDWYAIDVHDSQRSPAVDGHAQEREQRERNCER